MNEKMLEISLGLRHMQIEAYFRKEIKGRKRNIEHTFNRTPDIGHIFCIHSLIHSTFSDPEIWKTMCDVGMHPA